MKELAKPPKGLVPKYIHDQDRLIEVLRAILRYVEAGFSVSEDWIRECNDLLIKYNFERQQSEKKQSSENS